MRYYWLKLEEDFFRKKEIKKLRNIAGGDTYTVIYLKMQLLSLKNGGKIYYEAVEEDFVNELALELDEKVDNVRVTLLFLEKYNLIELVNESEYSMPNVVNNIESASANAMRVRKHRQKEQIELSPENSQIEIYKQEEQREEKKPISAKTKYADNVRMFSEQFQKLTEDYGATATKWMIEKLDSYKGSKGRAYKDDYKAILSWVVRAYHEETERRSKNANNRTNYTEKYKNPAGKATGTFTDADLDSLIR